MYLHLRPPVVIFLFEDFYFGRQAPMWAWDKLWYYVIMYTYGLESSYARISTAALPSQVGSEQPQERGQSYQAAH